MSRTPWIKLTCSTTFFATCAPLLAQCYDIKKSSQIIPQCQAFADCDVCDGPVWSYVPGTTCRKVASVLPTFQRTCVTGWVRVNLDGSCSCFPNDPGDQWGLITAQIVCEEDC